jgi:hypothetical protein
MLMYGMLKNRARYEIYTPSTKFIAISHQISAALLLGISAG